MTPSMQIVWVHAGMGVAAKIEYMRTWDTVTGRRTIHPHRL